MWNARLGVFEIENVTLGSYQFVTCQLAGWEINMVGREFETV